MGPGKNKSGSTGPVQTGTKKLAVPKNVGAMNVRGGVKPDSKRCGGMGPKPNKSGSTGSGC